MSPRASSLCSLAIFAISLPQAAAQLAAQWRFDEGSGNVYADSSPNGFDAFVTSFTAWSADVPPTGFDNTASLDLNGINEYVSTNFAGIGGDAARTIAFWIKSTAITNHGILAWGDSTGNGLKWHARLNNNAANGTQGAIRVETQGDYTIGTTFLADGEWHHVAAVYPGGGELATVELYIDGVLEIGRSDNASTQPVNTTLGVDPVTIGRRNQTGTLGWFDGGVDDVRIYERALSSAEVSALTGAAPPTDGLVLHMPFEEGSGNTTADLGSGGNPGSLEPLASPAPTWSDDAPPVLDHSLLFAGGGDLLYTDYPGIQGTGARSITFWFKTTNTADNGIIGWGQSAVDGAKWHARLNSSAADGPVGALRVEIQGGRVVATTPVADGQWHHAALVFPEDGDPDIADSIFYLDGAVDPISLFTSVPINTDSSGSSRFNVTIGGRFQGTVLRPFIGNLADVRIYESALSPEEVEAVMSGAGATGTLFQIIDLLYEPDLGSATLTWNSRPGETYIIDSSNDLKASPWFELADGWEAAEDAETTSFTALGIPPGTPRMFFRVKKE